MSCSEQAAVEQKAEKRDRFVATGVATALVLLALCLVQALRPAWPDIVLSNDFVGLWTGASLLSRGAGAHLFDLETQQAFQVELRRTLAVSPGLAASDACLAFYNPPPLALVVAPLTVLPAPTAYLAWTILGFLATLAAVALPLRGTACARTPAILMVTYPAVLLTLLIGQANWIYLLAFSLGLRALVSGPPFWGGVLMGVLWLKPQYAVLFPLVFLLKRRWLELAGMAASGLVVALLSLLLVGPSGIASLLAMMARMGAFYPPPGSFVNPQDMINWRSLLINLWPGIPEVTGSILTLVLGAMTIAASLLVWRGPWAPHSPRFARQMLIATMATLVASPHSHFHGLMMLLAPVSLSLAQQPAEASARRLWRQLLLAGYVVTLLVWPLASAIWEARPLFWVLAPCYTLALGILTFLLRVPERTPCDAVPQPSPR